MKKCTSLSSVKFLNRRLFREHKETQRIVKNHKLKMSKMLLSNLSSMSFCPSADSANVTPFWHSVLWQSLQAAMHVSPSFGRAGTLFPLHGFFYVIWQMHWINFYDLG